MDAEAIERTGSASAEATADKPAAAAEPAHAERVFAVAPEEDLLYSLSADGKRKWMHPIVHKGRYWQIRRAIAYALFVLFFALPLIPVGGKPAVFLDIFNRRSHIFGTAFYPTDSLILVSLGLGVIVTVFFVASTFGRMWCGYACPQTVYLEFLFRPIEAWLAPRRRSGPPERPGVGPTFRLAGRKDAITAAKWFAWTVLAVLMASNFVAYFTSWGLLLRGIASDPAAWSGALLTIGLVTGAIVFDFGWFRDQMCTIACPYGRLQNVMSDRDTILVAYDQVRGDPKVKVKDRKAGVLAGDCIDCRACVNACPTGTDIRRGLQPECIGTAQCIDACNEVMISRRKPIGLVRYTSEREQQGGVRHIWRPRTLVYLAIMTAAWGALGFLVFTRSDALVEVVRGGRESYRLLPNGNVANQQRLRITNQIGETQRFTVRVVGPPGATLVVSESPVVVRPDGVVTVNVVTTVPANAFVDGQVEARYSVKSDRGFEEEVTFVLLGPFGVSARLAVRPSLTAPRAVSRGGEASLPPGGAR